MRYEVHDEYGCIRKFDNKSLVENWLKNRKDFFLITIPKQKVKKIDVFSMEECLI